MVDAVLRDTLGLRLLHYAKLFPAYYYPHAKYRSIRLQEVIWNDDLNDRYMFFNAMCFSSC